MWIKASERMPEHDQIVLVEAWNGDVIVIQRASTPDIDLWKWDYLGVNGYDVELNFDCRIPEDFKATDGIVRWIALADLMEQKC